MSRDPGGYYYVWSGLGEVEEEDFEQVADDVAAIRMLHERSKSDHLRTWTLWHVLGGRPRLVAYCAPGARPVLIGEGGVPVRELPGTSAEGPSYCVNRGTIVKALRMVLSACGLTTDRMDAIINERIRELFNERFDHWLHNASTADTILNHIARVATGRETRSDARQASAMDTMIRETIQAEVKRIVAQGLQIDFNYHPRPPVPPEERPRRIRDPLERVDHP